MQRSFANCPRSDRDLVISYSCQNVSKFASDWWSVPFAADPPMVPCVRMAIRGEGWLGEAVIAVPPSGTTITSSIISTNGADSIWET